MQEEVEQKTVNLAVSTTKLTGRVLVKAIMWYLKHRKEKGLEKASEIPHGKQSVKELIGQNVGVSSIDISKTGLRDFQRIAKKFNVDFAVTKDKTVDPARYVIFFKARDADALNHVVKEHYARQMAKEQRPSVLEQLKKFKELVALLPRKARVMTKEHER
ncbi:MAG: PcfB family protein [Pseudobutyrivibrio sp.]|nr:PcfB family protein [Pseudobutyrivibrio sp.]